MNNTMINTALDRLPVRRGRLVPTMAILLLTGVFAISSAGCDNTAEETTDTGFIDETPDTGLTDTGDGQGNNSDLLYPDEAMKVAFIFAPKDDSGPIKTRDLHATEELTSYKLEAWKSNPMDLPDVTNITNPSLSENGEINCDLGCIMNPEGTWLLHYQVVDSETNNRKLQLSRLNIGYLLDKLSTRTIAEGTNLGKAMFAGSSIVYGKLLGNNDGMSIHAQRISGDGSDDHLVAEVPDIAGFTTDPNRARVIIFNATLSCMKIRLANAEGEPDNRLIYTIGQTCSAGGSEFSANEPAAVSPDGNYLAIVTKNKVDDLDIRWLRLQMINIGGTEGTVDGQFKLGPAGNSACQQNRGENEYTEATDLTWSPDGKYVYLLARANCGKFDVAESDILRFSVAADGSIEDRTNLTRNPKDNFPYALPIDAFSLSPQGKWMFLTMPPYEWISTRELYAISANAYETEGFVLTDTMIRLTRNRQLSVQFPMARPSR